MILYLHGFRSGPESFKAQALKRHMAARGLADRLWCGQLPPQPSAAAVLIERKIVSSPRPPTLIGSSLGGFYATVMTERHGLRAAVVNPAVPKFLSPEPFIGTHRHLYTNEPFEFGQRDIDQLAALDIDALTHPENFWLLVETGDEVLDYRHAKAFYAGARQTLLDGGSHAFTQWEAYLEPLLAFAGMAAPGKAAP